MSASWTFFILNWTGVEDGHDSIFIFKEAKHKIDQWPLCIAKPVWSFHSFHRNCIRKFMWIRNQIIAGQRWRRHIFFSFISIIIRIIGMKRSFDGNVSHCDWYVLVIVSFIFHTSLHLFWANSFRFSYFVSRFFFIFKLLRGNEDAPLVYLKAKGTTIRWKWLMSVIWLFSKMNHRTKE